LNMRLRLFNSSNLILELSLSEHESLLQLSKNLL